MTDKTAHNDSGLAVPEPVVAEPAGVGRTGAAASDLPTVETVTTTQFAFRRAARRVLATGVVLAVLALAGGAIVGGPAWVGAVWGAGAGAVLTLVTAASLLVDWDRFPLLASAGVAVSFGAKVLVMVVVVAAARGYRESMSGAWFFLSFAVILLSVTAVEVLGLARTRTLTVEPARKISGT